MSDEKFRMFDFFNQGTLFCQKLSWLVWKNEDIITVGHSSVFPTPMVSLYHIYHIYHSLSQFILHLSITVVLY